MARKSTPVGDLIVMDRAKIFGDLHKIKRRLKTALKKTDDEEIFGFIKTSVKDIKGE